MSDEDFEIIKDGVGISVKQYKSYNSNVLILSKNDLRIKFNYYKINNKIFININGEHLFEFKVLIGIDMLSNKDKTLIIKHGKLGEIIIKDCDIELFEKGMMIINEWVGKNRSYIKELFG